MGVGSLIPQNVWNRDSVLHSCDSRIKISLLLVYLITTALLPDGAWAVYLLMAGFLLVVALLSELPASYLIRRALMLEVPILLVLLPQIFLKSGQRFELSLWPDFMVVLSLTRLEHVANLLVRSWLSLQFAVVVMAATPFEELLAGSRAMGLPRLLTTILALMWRYLFVLVGEAQRLLQARSSRSSRRSDVKKGSGGSLIWRARVTGGMAGSLMLRSLDRSQRIYQAMLARGFDGEVRTIGPAQPLTIAQWAQIMTFILVGVIMLLIA